MSSIPDIRLNDGRTIPQLGLGVYQIAPRDTARAVRDALEAGYRHIDTAQMYGNERGVGEGVRDSGMARDEVFITSKLSNAAHRPDDARRAFDATLTDLGFEYVDLFLVHWPLPTLYGGDYVSTWRVLEEFQRDGRARSIGVSNFQPGHLYRLAAETDTVPSVNQVEVHPYFTNESIRAYGQRARHRDRGLVAAGAGRGPDGPGHRRHRRPARADAVPGGAALAHPARRRRVPQDRVAGADAREPRPLRRSSWRRTTWPSLAALDRGEAGRTGPHPDTFDWVPR